MYLQITNNFLVALFSQHFLLARAISSLTPPSKVAVFSSKRGVKVVVVVVEGISFHETVVMMMMMLTIVAVVVVVVVVVVVKNFHHYSGCFFSSSLASPIIDFLPHERYKRLLLFRIKKKSSSTNKPYQRHKHASLALL